MEEEEHAKFIKYFINLFRSGHEAAVDAYVDLLKRIDSMEAEFFRACIVIAKHKIDALKSALSEAGLGGARFERLASQTARTGLRR